MIKIKFKIPNKFENKLLNLKIEKGNTKPFTKEKRLGIVNVILSWKGK